MGGILSTQKLYEQHKINTTDQKSIIQHTTSSTKTIPKSRAFISTPKTAKTPSDMLPDEISTIERSLNELSELWNIKDLATTIDVKNNFVTKDLDRKYK